MQKLLSLLMPLYAVGAPFTAIAPVVAILFVIGAHLTAVPQPPHPPPAKE